VNQADGYDLDVIIGHVARFFYEAAPGARMETALTKSLLWFETMNPRLGYIAPIDMLRMGKIRKLCNFVKAAIEEGKEP
jgi:hypothetical protein